MIPHQFNRGDTTPGGIARYRQQSASAPYVHIRKRCACGSVVTAKQLDQYQCCATCVKKARINRLYANRYEVAL